MNRGPQVQILALAAVLLLSGCADERERKAHIIKTNNEARAACINSGGVPIPAWYDATAISNCVYAPVQEAAEQ